MRSFPPQDVQRHANSGLLVYGLCSVVSQAHIPGCQHPIFLGSHRSLNSPAMINDDLTHELAIDRHDDRGGTLPRGLRVALTLLWQDAGLMRGHILEKLLQLLIQCLCVDSHSKVAEHSVACLQASLAAPCKGKAFGS